MAKKPKKRNLNRLLQDRGEINLSTRTGQPAKPKYSRKTKHKGTNYD